MKLIQAKVKKGGVVEVEEEIPEEKREPEKTGAVVDLMPLLKKSLEAGRRTHAKSARGA
jgi:non-homologous end joining protein Ku